MTFQGRRTDDVKDLYPSEARALDKIRSALRMKHSFRGVTTIPEEDAIKHAFECEATNRCAEIGLLISVQWDADVSADPSDHNLYWIPRIIVDGRTDAMVEVDHDRMRSEIVSGLADGQPGYIRSDGSKREDPKSTTIY